MKTRRISISILTLFVLIISFSSANASGLSGRIDRAVEKLEFRDTRGVTWIPSQFTSSAKIRSEDSAFELGIPHGSRLFYQETTTEVSKGYNNLKQNAVSRGGEIKPPVEFKPLKLVRLGFSYSERDIDERYVDNVTFPPVNTYTHGFSGQFRTGKKHILEIGLKRGVLRQAMPDSFYRQQTRHISMELFPEKKSKFDWSIFAENVKNKKINGSTNHLRMSAEYKIFKGLGIKTTVGYYSRGVPMDEGPFSDFSGPLIWTYLYDDYGPLNKFYTHRLGYVSTSMFYSVNF